MLNYQKIHYNEYRILMEDGTEQKVSREECFAHAEEPTEDNPFKQRWCYSPDHTVAIRLPRNEIGEAMHRVNSTDLKAIERMEKLNDFCVGEFNLDTCPINCSNCYVKDYCVSKYRNSNGYGCKRKCENCSVSTNKFISMDKPVGMNDNGDLIYKEFNNGEIIEDEYCQQEDNDAFYNKLLEVVSTLNHEDKKLYQCIQQGLSNEEISRLFGFTETAVRKRKKRLCKIFEKGGFKNHL